jgi:hypothetical protein
MDENMTLKLATDALGIHGGFGKKGDDGIRSPGPEYDVGCTQEENRRFSNLRKCKKWD